MRSRWPILAILSLLASLLVPGMASASTASGAETRVWAFDLADGACVGVECSLTRELHQGCELAYDQLASDSLLAARGGRPAFTHGHKYHPRVRARGVQDPKAHNFPYSFDDAILKQKPITQADGSLLYRQPGALNGKEGFFEIGVNPETNTIFHRTFVGGK